MKWFTSKENGEDDGKLVDGVARDVLEHEPRDERLRTAVRTAV